MEKILIIMVLLYQETRRRQQVEAAERRRQQEEARGVKDPLRVQQQQLKAAVNERKAEELNREGGPTLRVSIKSTAAENVMPAILLLWIEPSWTWIDTKCVYKMSN